MDHPKTQHMQYVGLVTQEDEMPSSHTLNAAPNPEPSPPAPSSTEPSHAAPSPIRTAAPTAGPGATAGLDAAFWDRLAEGYAAQPVANPDAFERKIAITRALLRPDAVALDVGCGTGSLALRLVDACAEVHGVDLSAEMIRIARAKATAAGADRAHFHVGPFGVSPDERLEALGEGSVDLLCAYSILHLVPDRAAALAHAWRLLKPGGALVSSTVCLGGPARVLYAPLLGLMRTFGKAPHVQLFTPAQLQAELVDAGFVDVTAHEVGAKSSIAFLVARKPEEGRS